MIKRRDVKMLVLGGAAMSATLLAAWSVRPPVAVDPAPMEEVLTEVASVPDVVTWDITVTRNERVEDWIDFLTGRNRDRTALWLERSGRYGPMIRAELRERGMPEDLLYLALIESGFSPRAYSSASASGIWQFIAETGTRYGLEVNSVVDERRDPVRSTDAALSYLGDLYDRFGSWYLAAAAYNTGENRVGRIMRDMFGTERGTDDHFWQIAHRLPRETRDYVPLMLAAGHIAKEPEVFGFTDLRYQAPLVYDVTWVPGSVSLDAIVRAVMVPVDSIADLNTHLMAGFTPEGRAWPVRLPSGSAEQFSVRFPGIYREARAEAVSGRAEQRYHQVRRGESLWTISRRYDISMGQLRAWNGLGSRNVIHPGQRLRVST